MIDDPDQHEQLSYFISEKPPFLVVSLSGQLVVGAEATIKKCQEEIAERTSSLIVFNLQNLKTANIGAVADFVKLQVAARHKGSLRLCFLDQAVGEFLFQRGAIREDEVVEDLKAALASLGSTVPG